MVARVHQALGLGILVAGLLLVGPAAAQGEPPDGEFPALPAELPPGDDWVRSNAGEWVTGTLTSMRSDTLEFTSKGFGGLSLGWSDVAELRSPNTNSYVLEDLSVLTGPALLRGGELLVETEEGPRRVAQGRVLSIIPGVPSERSYWSGKLSLGFTATTGNARTRSGTVLMNIIRRDAYTRLRLRYAATYAEAAREEQARVHDGGLKLDAYLSRRLYVVPALAQVTYDKFKNIALRATAGAGAGYHLLLGAPLEWDLEAEPVFTYTERRRAPAGETRFDSQVHLRLATRLTWAISDAVTLTGEYVVFVGVDDIENTFHHAEGTLSVELIDDLLSLDLTCLWDRVERPLPDDEGRRPHHDDGRFIVGLTVTF